jgi:hypothetical protein
MSNMKFIRMARLGENPADLVGTEMTITGTRHRITGADRYPGLDAFELTLEEIDPPHRCTCTRPGHGDGPCVEIVDDPDESCSACIDGC